MTLEFEWDERKNEINLLKHDVSFEEAKEIWADEKSLEFYDPNHSSLEDRFVRIGHSFNLKIILVIFCEPRVDSIRIISARKATKKEIKQYEERIRFR